MSRKQHSNRMTDDDVVRYLKYYQQKARETSSSISSTLAQISPESKEEERHVQTLSRGVAHGRRSDLFCHRRLEQ